MRPTLSARCKRSHSAVPSTGIASGQKGRKHRVGASQRMWTNLIPHSPPPWLLYGMTVHETSLGVGAGYPPHFCRAAGSTRRRMALIEVEGGESFSAQMCAPTFVGMARVWLARRRFLLGEQQRFFFASSQVRSASLDHESLPRLRLSLERAGGCRPAPTTPPIAISIRGQRRSCWYGDTTAHCQIPH